MNIPKNDENSAGNIIGIRVSNTTTSAKKIPRMKLFESFQIHSFKELFAWVN